MKKKNVIWVVLFGAVVVLGMIALQLYWVINEWNSESRKTQQTIYVALYNVANEIAKIDNFSLSTQDLIHPVTSNYFVVNINNTIDSEVLESVMLDQLRKLNLNLDFEYGIYDCTNDEMVYGDYCALSDKQPKARLGNLQKLEDLTYYFGIRFPGLKGNILDNMIPSILYSVVTLLALIFFVLTVIIILRQKRFSDLQTDFINNLTHEFKTPISSIKLASDFLAQDQRIQDENRLSRYTKIIQQQNEKLSQNIDKILSLAKMEKGDLVLNLEPINLNLAVREIADEFSLQIENKNGNLTLDIPDQEIPIQADKSHLNHMLNNLMDNAIKYSNGEIHIALKVVSDNKATHVVVSDQGIGMDEEVQNKLFHKFYRAPTGNVHNVKGFGLGLFYVKKICDAHGWDIKINSKPNQGTEIDVVIKQ